MVNVRGVCGSRERMRKRAFFSSLLSCKVRKVRYRPREPGSPSTALLNLCFGLTFRRRWLSPFYPLGLGCEGGVQSWPTRVAPSTPVNRAKTAPFPTIRHPRSPDSRCSRPKLTISPTCPPTHTARPSSAHPSSPPARAGPGYPAVGDRSLSRAPGCPHRAKRRTHGFDHGTPLSGKL